ncbi:LPS translocon maturation chaperone LptM [Escherichia coli]|uniref:LPS translocon maturation chaperone LptM n=1 Tax=Escherichia coli TaxID=562 RepID=UPI000BB87273|nr:lipoprotein [Escherichia coli]
MKNVFKALTVLITLFSLTGCGLKGPLYFPPADKNAPPPTKPVETQTQSTVPVSVILAAFPHFSDFIKSR